MDEMLIIRADAGGLLGTGHVLRMIALAQAYIESGGKVTILSVSCPEAIQRKVTELGVGFHLLPESELGSESDTQFTLEYCARLGAKAMVLDGYHFDEAYLNRVSDANVNIKVLILDDYGHCDTWNCDFVLNQNLGSEKLNYKTAERTDLLLGAPYALLRSDIKETLQLAIEKKAPYNKMIITLGGSDIDNVTSLVLSVINQIDHPLEIKVLVGAANPNKASIQELTDQSKHEVELLGNVSDMPSLYLWADCIISAGGSTCWEWLAYGLHGAVVTIADNQEPIVRELINENLALSLGWPDGEQSANWVELISEWLLSDSLAGYTASRKLIDGNGSNRVARKLSECSYYAREATLDDVHLYFEWANDPEVRKNAFNSDPIIFENHKKWFEKRVIDETCIMVIIEHPDLGPIGQVRLEKLDSSPKWEIDYSIKEDCRGKGLGTMMIKNAVCFIDNRLAKGDSLMAKVKKQNIASARVFERLGWQKCPLESDIITFTKTF